MIIKKLIKNNLVTLKLNLKNRYHLKILVLFCFFCIMKIDVKPYLFLYKFDIFLYYNLNLLILDILEKILLKYCYKNIKTF